MSGGVDSSVSALLLKEAGFDVTGVFIKAWHPDWLPCDWKTERRDAMRVAAFARIPFMTLDLEKEYKKEVVDEMIREYKAGRTPNPDVLCNKEIKFGHFLRFAQKNGADYVATGHYAQKEEYRTKNKGLKYTLKKSKDTEKDQTYFLWTLTQDQLAHTLFPIGHMTKKQVRSYAKKHHIPVAEKKDSQGLCFIGKIDLKDFLKEFVTSQKGKVLNQEGAPIGSHDGALFYTIGQRHGFTIVNQHEESKPYYVISKNVAKNTITVAHEFDDVREIKQIYLTNTHFPLGEPDIGEVLEVLPRYRHEYVRGTYQKDGRKTFISLNKGIQSVASGQSLVIYKGNLCIGGGIIE